MSIVQKSPLFDYSNFTNTAFSVTYTGTFFKVTFAAPISQTYFLNRELYNVKYSDLGANYVDLGEFDWGILTVNYALCTSPVAGSRDAWIDAVNALITYPNIGPTTLATGNYLTDTYIGYNKTTKQFTDLGTRVYFKATKSNSQTFTPIGTLVPTTIVLYNVVVADTANGYNAATGRYTVPQDGDYQVTYQVSTSSSAAFTSIIVNGTTQYNFANTARTFSTQIIPCVAGDIIDIRCNTTGGSTSNLTVANDNYFVITRVFT